MHRHLDPITARQESDLSNAKYLCAFKLTGTRTSTTKFFQIRPKCLGFAPMVWASSDRPCKNESRLNISSSGAPPSSSLRSLCLDDKREMRDSSRFTSIYSWMAAKSHERESLQGAHSASTASKHTINIHSIGIWLAIGAPVAHWAQISIEDGVC